MVKNEFLFFKQKFSTILIIALIFSLFSSCITMKTAQYFKLQENRIDNFKCYFIKDDNDKDYKMVEDIFGKISNSDTVVENREIIYKTTYIDGYKVFYAIETSDTLKSNPTIGPVYYFFCSMLFKNDTLMLTPVYKLNELKTKRLYNFIYKIPPLLKKSDSITIYDGKKISIIKSFNKECVKVNSRKFRNCLTFKIIDIWPSTTYTATIWLDKKYGLIKWIRNTGRVEKRIIKN